MDHQNHYQQTAGPSQMDLFQAVQTAYESAEGSLDNAALYRILAERKVLDDADLKHKAPVGQAGKTYNLTKRKIRWVQQTLRQLGAIERVLGDRGVWRLVANGSKELTPAQPGAALVAFSTKLGLALWADCSAFSKINEPISLILTSPPYPLATPRAYGNPQAREFTDFLCSALEPLIKLMQPGASLCLNLSNDIFNPSQPTRSTYLERLTIALEDRLGLHLCDRLIWENPAKPPGPTYWACRERIQLVHTWEPVLWFTNDPDRCFADNRRVLQPHSERHLKLIEQGGEDRSTSYGDGAHRLRPGSFGQASPGKIPRNILRFAHETRSISPIRKAVQAAGLPTHGALMPAGLARFLIEFLTRPGDLVADLFGGWQTTACAAEDTGRRWITTEKMAQYVVGGSFRFHDTQGFHTSFDLQTV